MEKHIESFPTSRIAKIIILMGLAVLLSTLIINPWIGKLYRANIVNVYDVMLSYVLWATVIGVMIIGSGVVLKIIPSSLIEKLTVLLLTCLFVLLFDKLLLVFWGLPLWQGDMENHFIHRPGAIRTWGPDASSKHIQINKWGHHDDDFPMKKKTLEFRGLILGDSITMGHGVTSDETFSNQLEDLLEKKDTRYKTFQIINTGVQGYSTSQEYNLLLRSLIFDPDFIAIGFCMNDITEPSIVDKNFGGVGIDYHNIMQVSSSFTSYLINETGIGRTIQKLQDSKRSLKSEKKFAIYNVKNMVSEAVDEKLLLENWNVVLSSLGQIYDLAKEKNIPVVLLIFPHTFQLMNKSFQRPQQKLLEHAQKYSVDVIDFTKIFEELFFEKKDIEGLLQSGISYDDIYLLYDKKIKQYFLDFDHYTVEGHQLVATELSKYLLRPRSQLKQN